MTGRNSNHAKGLGKSLYPGIFKSMGGGNSSFAIKNNTLYLVTDSATTAITLQSQVAAGTLDKVDWDFGDGAGVNNSYNGNHTYATTGLSTIKITFHCPLSQVTNFSLAGIASSAGFVGVVDLRKFTSLTTIIVENSKNIGSANTGKTGVTKILFPNLSGTNPVTFLGIFNNQLSGVLDLRPLANIATDIEFNGNSGITGVHFPAIIGNVTQFLCNGCNLLGNLDLSNMVLSGLFNVNSNANLTSITHKSSSGAWTSYYRASACNLTGVHDLSMLTNLGKELNLSSNSLLTGVTLPTNANTWTLLTVQSCNITGTFDLSMLTGLGGQVILTSNANLTAVTWPTSSQNFTSLEMGACKITGTLNLSTLTGGFGQLLFYGNSLLTAVTFPSSSASCNVIYAYQCNLTGTIDVSPMTSVGGTAGSSGALVYFFSNPLLTRLILPTNSRAILTFQIQSCACTQINFTAMPNIAEVNNAVINIANNGMTAAQLNTMLVDINAGASGSYTGRVITANGTNAAPTGAGLTAKTALQGKGFTVTTN